MRRTTRWLLVLGMLGAGLAAGAARAQQPGEVPEGPGPWAGEEMGPDLAMGPSPMEHGPGMGPGAMRHGPRMGRGGPGFRDGLGFGPGIARELDLTAEQRERMRTVRERQQRRAIQTRADLQLARLDLHKLMQAEKPDPRAIEAQIDRIAALRTGLEKSRAATMLELRSVLTPDQQRKLRELREQGPAERIRRVIRERQVGPGEGRPD